MVFQRRHRDFGWERLYRTQGFVAERQTHKRGTWGIRSGGGHPPVEPAFIVTHTFPQVWAKKGSPFTYVTDGVESAIRQAQKAAGGKDVVICTASILRQCLRASLVDEIYIDLAPFLLGRGVRLFDQLDAVPVDLKGICAIEVPGVTHLGFRVVK